MRPLRSVTSGGAGGENPFSKIFSPSLEKFVGHSL